jgi:hypothetical protein
MEENISTDHTIYAFTLWYSYGNLEEYNNQSQSHINCTTEKHAFSLCCKFENQENEKPQALYDFHCNPCNTKSCLLLLELSVETQRTVKATHTLLVILRRKTQYESFPCLTLLRTSIKYKNMPSLLGIIVKTNKYKVVQT